VVEVLVVVAVVVVINFIKATMLRLQ
jgi:hypothetical protein